MYINALDKNSPIWFLELSSLKQKYRFWVICLFVVVLAEFIAHTIYNFVIYLLSRFRFSLAQNLLSTPKLALITKYELDKVEFNKYSIGREILKKYSSESLIQVDILWETLCLSIKSENLTVFLEDISSCFQLSTRKDKLLNDSAFLNIKSKYNEAKIKKIVSNYGANSLGICGGINCYFNAICRRWTNYLFGSQVNTAYREVFCYD